MRRSSRVWLSLVAAAATVLLRVTRWSGDAFLFARVSATQQHRAQRRTLGVGCRLVAVPPQRRERVQARYKVTLETPDGEQTFECPPDKFILAQAEDEGIELPYSCLTGQCSVCTGRVLEGTIDQSTQEFLTEEKVKEGYCLTCVTKPTSDVRIKTHCDNELPPLVTVTKEEMEDMQDFGFGGGDGGVEF